MGSNMSRSLLARRCSFLPCGNRSGEAARIARHCPTIALKKIDNYSFSNVNKKAGKVVNTGTKPFTSHRSY
jgi:hypothetical protein